MQMRSILIGWQKNKILLEEKMNPLEYPEDTRNSIARFLEDKLGCYWQMQSDKFTSSFKFYFGLFKLISLHGFWSKSIRTVEFLHGYPVDFSLG
jgi:hypothetical protein